MSRKREEFGRNTETVTPGHVLGVFESVEGPVVTSADVARELDCSRESARRKLAQLEEDGCVGSRTTARRVVWWRTDDRVGPRDVCPDDEFWDVEPGSSGESDVSENVDGILYWNHRA